METAIKTHDFASAPVNQSLKPEEKIRLLRDMMRIRRFEQAATQAYQGDKIGGFLHLYNGQESVAVGCCSLMGPHDHVITAYRDHGHALAVGMTMNECMAELFGKATGCSKGRGGSMHFFAPDKNYWGGHGIVGGQTPLGLGLAYGIKYKGLAGAALCFMGDGAVNQGCYYESLNLASLWDLPVVYIIENNQYSMGTSLERSSAFRSCLAERAEGFAIDWEQINGQDLYEVRAGVQVAIERAHRQSRPTVLEIDTYRYHGHSIADANAKKYRREEEIERYKTQHDPINLWKARLMQENVVTEEKIEELAAAVEQEVQDCLRFAEESPALAESAITEDVYFEVDRQTQAGRTGRHFFND
jgi:pyruvate dehydrogenase E1 component alpha subunit